MANKTVVFNSQAYAGTAGLTLLLLNPETGAIGNGSGDTLTAGSNGVFSAVVTENIDGWWNVVVMNGAVPVLEGGKIYFQSDTAGTYVVDDGWQYGMSTWDSDYADHNQAGTFGKLMDILRKANAVVEGTVLAAPAPTTTIFNVSGMNYPTGAFDKAVLWFASDASIAEQNSPILTFVNNGDGTQTIVLQEPLTQAPIAGDAILIDPTSHVHTIAEIQSGLATTAQVTASFEEIKGTGWSSSTDTLKEISDIASEFNITVAPLQATSPARVSGHELMTFNDDLSQLGPIVIEDANNTPIDLSGYTLIVSIQKLDDTILANITPSVSGINNNQITFTPTSQCVAKTGVFRWSLRETVNGIVFAHGDFIVDPAAELL